MYRNTDVVYPSRQRSQTRKDHSQPLNPHQSELCPHQFASFGNDYPQQVPQVRDQGALDTGCLPSQGPYQPLSSIDEVYDSQQRTYQRLYPAIPPYASPQSFCETPQTIDRNEHVHLQSNLEQMPYAPPSTTSRTLSYHPSIEEYISYKGDVPPSAVEQGDELTQAFFDSADDSGIDMTNPLWDPNFDALWADWQVTDADTGAGEPQQCIDEPPPDSQLGKQQAYPNSCLGTGRQSYSGGNLQSFSGVIPTKSNHEQLTRSQYSSLADVDQLGQTTPFMTLAGQIDGPSYGNAEFSWGTTSQGSWNNTLQHHQSQQYRNSQDLLSCNTTSYQTTEDSSASQQEQSWGPMHPRKPHHSISTSGTSSSGYRMFDRDGVERFSSSKGSKRGGQRHRFIHGQLNHNPIAITRVAKKPVKERAHFFCARRGCKKLVSRLSDLDRHEKTQHGIEEDGFLCLFCPSEKQKKFSVIYNLRAHIARTHPEVNLHTNPDGPTVLSWKDNFAKVSFYKNSLDGEILLRAHSDVATFLAGLKTSSSGNEDPDYLQTALDAQIERWMNST